MNQEIKNYIKILTEHDQKTLSQKFTKTVEEIGELGSKILPFEDADGTVHRFVEREQILEECVDVMLCINSIIEELKFSPNEINDMFHSKLNKWAEIQSQEKRVSGKPIPFEIHVTVKLNEEQTIDQFREICDQIEVKPIILDLQTQEGNIIKDVMTSSWHLGNNTSAYNQVNNISEQLKQSGFDVVRKKIETVPWHPASPKTQNEVMPNDCYFESHLAIICTDDHRTFLESLCKQYNVHLSRNIYKKIINEKYIIMGTIRSYNDYESNFKERVQQIRKDLINNGFEVQREIVEFSIYDTKVNHDSKWLNKTTV